MKNESRADRERQVLNFLSELKKTQKTVNWFIEPRLGLRGEHPELSHYLCPIAAIHFHKTGESHPTRYGHPIGDPHLLAERYGWAMISSDIVDTADNNLDSHFGRLTLQAVGISKGRSK